MSARPGFVEPHHFWHRTSTRSAYRRLYPVTATILVVGLVVGVILPGVSGAAVLTGVAMLAALIAALFMVGHRDETDHSDDYVYDLTTHPRR